MKKIEKETCIKFEERSRNQHKELVSLDRYLLVPRTAGLKELFF